MRAAWRQGDKCTVTKFSLFVSGCGLSVCVSYLLLGHSGSWTWREKSTLGSSSKVVYHQFCGIQQIPGVSLWWKVVIHFCLSSLSLNLTPLIRPQLQQLFATSFRSGSLCSHLALSVAVHCILVYWGCCWWNWHPQFVCSAIKVLLYDCWMSVKKQSRGKCVDSEWLMPNPVIYHWCYHGNIFW